MSSSLDGLMGVSRSRRVALCPKNSKHNITTILLSKNVNETQFKNTHRYRRAGKHFYSLSKYNEYIFLNAFAQSQNVLRFGEHRGNTASGKGSHKWAQNEPLSGKSHGNGQEN